MTFPESVRTCLIQKYLFRFKGRASRSEFWWFMLFISLVNLATGFVTAQLPLRLGASLSLGISLLLFPANLGVAVRRFHDRNLSGWWLLIPIITLLLWFVAGGPTQPPNMVTNAFSLAMCLCYLVILCMPGSVGENRYGPAPQPQKVW